MPTRNGRNACLFTKAGIINLRNEKWKFDFTPLDEISELFADRAYTKAYLRHLFMNGEMLASMVGSLHNLHSYLNLVREARKHIQQGDFTAWKNEQVPILSRRI